jgi:protein ImuB
VLTRATVDRADDATRVIVVWCPAWPVMAAGMTAGLTSDVPVAVVAANRVVACSAPAWTDGVRGGMRQREAQERCPELVLLPTDPGRDARLFEPVVAAVEELAPGADVIHPGLVAVPAQGPISYFGDAQTVAERLIDRVAARARVECQVGAADGLFAAMLAAHRGLVVPPGGSPEFLAPLSIAELDQPMEKWDGRARSERADLVDLLHRLGMRTLGAFAAIPARDVASRFGTDAVIAHRLARGLSAGQLARRRPPPDLAVAEVLDPPADRIDNAAFAAKGVAELLHSRLSAHGLACVRLAIQAETEQGELLSRVWRCAEPLALAGIVDRVRWQLDGWLRAGGGVGRSGGGLRMLRLVPEEVIDGPALQLGLWAGADGSPAEAERAGRALLRVQGLLGPEGLFTAVLGGGRGPGEQVRWVPWGDKPVPEVDPEAPWPGRLPAPSPATVPRKPLPAVVVDETGAEVGVTGRRRLTASPHRISVDGGPARPVRAWAGPWLTVERWWTDGDRHRLARLQVLARGRHGDEASDEASDEAFLLLREGGQWLVEGIYD